MHYNGCEEARSIIMVMALCPNRRHRGVLCVSTSRGLGHAELQDVPSTVTQFLFFQLHAHIRPSCCVCLSTRAHSQHSITCSRFCLRSTHGHIVLAQIIHHCESCLINSCIEFISRSLVAFSLPVALQQVDWLDEVLSLDMCTQDAPVPAMSCIFHIEEVEVPATDRQQPSDESLLKSVKRMCRPRSNYERQLKADVQFFSRSNSETGVADILGLACNLANLGYEIKVRYAEGGGANCFKNLCHEFILVKGRGDSKGSDVVVECGFHDHFRIPCATRAYSKLFDQLPAVYVGTVQNMSPLVELISHEMSRSFLEKGVTMPPWRGARALMSKWSPQRSIDRLPGQASPRSRSTPMSSAEVAAADTSVQRKVSAVAEARVDTAAEHRPVSASDRSEAARTDIGALARPVGCPDRPSSMRATSTWHLRQGSRACSGGSPVLSVKLGFDFPAARAPLQ
eukprot:jgi/Ulvmu1/10190/UM006_0146.1